MKTQLHRVCSHQSPLLKGVVVCILLYTISSVIHHFENGIKTDVVNRFSPEVKSQQLANKLLYFNNSQKAVEFTTADDLILHLQDTTLRILKHALAGYKYAVLFDVTNMENKGDPAIGPFSTS